MIVDSAAMEQTEAVPMKLNKMSRVPLYIQASAYLRDALYREAWGKDGVLPSERDLAEELNISRLTLRRALTLLEADGAVVRRQGARTLTGRRIEQALPVLTSFTSDMNARGYHARSRWINRQLGRPTGEETLALGIGPNIQVARLFRVRYADDEAIVVERATVPATYLPPLGEIEDSLYATLEARGWTPVRAVQRIWAAGLPKVEADLLGVQPGSPTLCSQRITYLSNGIALEFTLAHYRAEKYDFIIELHGKSTENGSIEVSKI